MIYKALYLSIIFSGTIWLLLGIALVFITYYVIFRKQQKAPDQTYRKKTKKNPPKKENNSALKKKKSVEYPSFRSKNSGLTWGGGNIHGANAKRGEKKGFLKK